MLKENKKKSITHPPPQKKKLTTRPQNRATINWMLPFFFVLPATKRKVTLPQVTFITYWLTWSSLSLMMMNSSPCLLVKYPPSSSSRNNSSCFCWRLTASSSQAASRVAWYRSSRPWRVTKVTYKQVGMVQFQNYIFIITKSIPWKTYKKLVLYIQYRRIR